MGRIVTNPRTKGSIKNGLHDSLKAQNSCGLNEVVNYETKEDKSSVGTLVLDTAEKFHSDVTAPKVSEAPAWNGPVLNRSNGKIMGPSGEETYYNLKMGAIEKASQPGGWIYNQAVANGYQSNIEGGSYWVREDGVKMWGKFVMVAANLKVHPRGSLVETSLGTGIVLDTGGFAVDHPNRLDIAVNW